MANQESTAGPSPVAVCFAGMLALAVAMGIGRFAFTPMLPLMIQGAGLDVASGGWIAAANYAGYLVGALTASRVPMGAVRLGIVALLATALLTAAMALPGPAVLWAVLRFAAGVASAWVFVSTAVWCLGALARMHRAAWGGAVYFGVGAGIALAGLWCLAGGVAGASPAALWIQLGLLAAALMVPVVIVMRKVGEAPPPAAASAAPSPPPPGTTGLVISYGAFGFGYILPATFLPVLARSVVEDPRLFGLAWPVFGAMAAVSTLLASWFMRRASRLQVWSAAHMLMGLGVLLPSVSASGTAIALSALLVGGTFMVITMAGVQEIRARAVGDPTRWVARMTGAFALGQIAGPMVSSMLLHLPLHGMNGLNLALQAGAAALWLSGAWLWREAGFSLTRERMSHAR
ncbi:YbfB/YjiJ family MFS transporter [Caenimonas aquaedulcis]|uniref:YbfB/YjiJ family MFS transporter n=1 Tax=Caenimonas aquaedulcis TaxID=2793270 RepID=A0A931H5X4_9BURK|nr:YbfB/YjiJ family MFS transporter [Caenimonas aquaedulcis]MBG9389171.1 YbfB/YjiJ family MFS transporter [Caenimonas aquaedulcis]